MSGLETPGCESSASTPASRYSSNQEQTRNAFSFKWAKPDSYDSGVARERYRNWLLERYCDSDPGRIEAWLAGGRKTILDAGCGPGLAAVLFFGDHLRLHDYLGVDISDSIPLARERFENLGYPGNFLQMDLFDIPLPEASVDVIFSEGVLHHTDSTEKALKLLASKLRPGGRFLFYVYARKAVIREFTDDHIREYLRRLSDEEAWEALKSLTKFGMALGAMNIEIEVPEDIPFLGIGKGKMDLQRFFYWNICKLYYREDYTLEEMNHINFDWFRPLNCHRHTPEEIRLWCGEAGLEIETMKIQESGITVIALKR